MSILSLMRRSPFRSTANGSVTGLHGVSGSAPTEPAEYESTQVRGGAGRRQGEGKVAFRTLQSEGLEHQAGISNCSAAYQVNSRFAGTGRPAITVLCTPSNSRGSG